MRRSLTDRRMVVALIAVLAVVLRIGWQLRTGFYEGPLAFEEDEIARNILAGRGYVYQFQELGTGFVSFGLTGLPLLLAVLHFFDPGYTLIGLVQAGLSAIVVVAAYALGRDLLSPASGSARRLGGGGASGARHHGRSSRHLTLYDHAVA